MSIPEGWRPLDFGQHFEHVETHFTHHIGPLFMRGDNHDKQIGFRVEAHMCNPIGVCHGGMLMTVMDVGLAFGLHNAMGQLSFTPTVSFNFDFLASAKEGDFLICEAQATQHTKSTGFVTGRLVGPDGPVISGSGIYKITGTTFD